MPKKKISISPEIKEEKEVKENENENENEVKKKKILKVFFIEKFLEVFKEIIVNYELCRMKLFSGFIYYRNKIKSSGKLEISYAHIVQIKN